MFNAEKNIYIQETEIKPNQYAMKVLLVTLTGILFCWVVTELGLFRVGKTEIRIGSILSLLVIAVPYFFMQFNHNLFAAAYTKYILIAAASVFTLVTTTLLTFHTTIMLLFPIFIAMLYRSKKIGTIAVLSSVFCAVVTPILGYLLQTWDIELFKELILIGTNGTAVVEGAHPGFTLLSVGKIVLYLGLPRLLMVGSCGLLLFYVIGISEAHVENQILLHRLSHRDRLTGLYNRNYYMELISSSGFSGQVGVIYFDVNNLKQLNDSEGHEAGDLLLQRCAKTLLCVCDGESSAAFRLGGDEFLLLIADADEAALAEKSREWNAQLEKVNAENRALYNGLVCSMAVGFAVGSFGDLEELVHDADERMYKNKTAQKTEGTVAEQ